MPLLRNCFVFGLLVLAARPLWGQTGPVPAQARRAVAAVRIDPSDVIRLDGRLDTHNWLDDPLQARTYTLDRRLASKVLYTHRF